MSLQQKMRLPAYQNLYKNVRKRLCHYEESLEQDFFTQRHSGDEEFIRQYRDQPTAYDCISSASLTHSGGNKTTYLVIGGHDRVVLLLEPTDAITRNLPFLSVLTGHFFRPCLESAPEYWQTHIEPQTRKSENVLHRISREKDLVPNFIKI